MPVTKRSQPMRKARNVLRNSSSMTFWKENTMESFKNSVLSRLQERRMTRWSTEGFKGSETIVYDTVVVFKHWTQATECTTRGANPDVNHGLSEQRAAPAHPP